MATKTEKTKPVATVANTLDAARLAALHRIADDITGRHYDMEFDIEVAQDIMERILGHVTWPQVPRQFVRDILTLAYTAETDEGLRKSMVEVAESEHREFCTCCKNAHAKREHDIAEGNRILKIITENSKTAESAAPRKQKGAK